MRLALALDTTSDEFLMGSVQHDGEQWQDVVQLLQTMNSRKLELARNFLSWLNDQNI